MAWLFRLHLTDRLVSRVNFTSGLLLLITDPYSVEYSVVTVPLSSSFCILAKCIWRSVLRATVVWVRLSLPVACLPKVFRASVLISTWSDSRFSFKWFHRFSNAALTVIASFGSLIVRMLCLLSRNLAELLLEVALSKGTWDSRLPRFLASLIIACVFSSSCSFDDAERTVVDMTCRNVAILCIIIPPIWINIKSPNITRNVNPRGSSVIDLWCLSSQGHGKWRTSVFACRTQRVIINDPLRNKNPIDIRLRNSIKSSLMPSCSSLVSTNGFKYRSINCCKKDKRFIPSFETLSNSFIVI